MIRQLIFAAVALLLVPSGFARAEATVPTLILVGGTVVRPDLPSSQAVQANTTVVIAGSRIVSVMPAAKASVPKGARIVDARRKWIIPGLVDGHVHFFQSGNLYTRPDIADLTRDVPYRQEDTRNRGRLPVTLKLYLASGVTGVVDVGGPFWNFDLRDRARRSQAAPRVAVAGPLLATTSRPQLDLGDPPIINVDTPAAAQALVRRELERKPDFIKFWFIHRPGDDLAAQEKIVRAAGETAHAAGVRFAVHATELTVAKAALRAGADVLVHSVEDRPVDDEFLRLAKRNLIIYTPTLFVIEGYRLALSRKWNPTPVESRLGDPSIVKVLSDHSRVPDPSRSPSVAKALSRFGGRAESVLAAQNLRKVWDAGINVVMGTDAGNIGTLHGASVFRELALMVKAGLTPQQALLSATFNAARMMGLERELGAIAPGRLADLVILDADPLANVANLSRIHRVMKDGVLFIPAELTRAARGR